MKDDKQPPWEILATRITVETSPVGEGAPYGFSTKIVAQWRVMQRDAVLRRWSFLSLRAALGSAALCGIIVVFHSMKEDPKTLIEPPSVEFLTPPLSSR